MDQEPKKILFICGSLRKGSLNRQVGMIAESMLAGKADIEWLEYSDLPYMNQDIEFPAPDAVKKLREKISAADALWIFSPEYNHNMPGVLKNMLDWASRAQTKGETDSVMAGKLIAFCNAAGSSSGRYSSAALQETLSIMRAVPLEPIHLQVRLDRDEFTTSKLDLSDEYRKILQRQADTLIALLSDRL